MLVAVGNVVAVSTLLAVSADSFHLGATLAAGCFAAGLILTAVGAWQRRTVMQLLADGKRATATAVDSVLHHHEGPDESHHVVWRFETRDGMAIEHEALAAGVQSVELGEKSKIIYDPADPHNARLETLAERTLSWALFFYTGIALLVIAAVSAILEVI